MKKNLTFRYCIHQFAYWAASAGVISFATTFLLAKGFPAGRVGALLACASILSGVSQPLLAAFADRRGGHSIVRLTILLSLLSTLCFAALLLDGIHAAAFGIIYLCGVWAFDTMIPLMNAVSVHYNGAGCKINYGVGRGVGSLSYSLAALALGGIMERFSADSMIYAVLLLLPMVILICLTYPKVCSGGAELGEMSSSSAGCRAAVFFRRYPWYCLSLGGVMLLAMFHAMTENYLIVIMGRFGGGSGSVGTALFIATVAEAAVLFCFDGVRKRISDAWLIKFAALSFLLKSLLFLAADSIGFIYCLQLLQMTSYAFLSPVQVYYAEAKVAAEDMVKGQAFITASYTLGCAIGNLFGGYFVQNHGVDALLAAGVAMAAGGTALLFLTVGKKDAFKLGAPSK